MGITGLGATLIEDTSTNTKLTAADWKVRGISGGGRSLATIDDSHLGQNKGQGLELCFADLYSQEPFVLDAQLNTDSTVLFDTLADDTNPQDVPVRLGDIAGVPEQFILTLPVGTLTTGAKLTFTGAIIRDSGYNLVSSDRTRMTLTVQPDMKTYSWAPPS